MPSRVRFCAVPLLSSLACMTLCSSSPFAVAAMHKRTDAAYYLKADPKAGDIVSDITYRVIATHGPGIEDNVWQVPATGTYTILSSDSPGVIKWNVSVRMDGKLAIKDADGDYRDDGKTMCFKGKCSFTTDASGPFFNPPFWGNPQGDLKPGMSWTVELTQPWELGPPGKQTVTVLSVDKLNGMVVLKREGQGVGSYEGKHDVALIMRDGKLSSPEVGTIQAQERQYMSLLQHPGAIEN